MLYQHYYVANLVLITFLAGDPMVVNPGNLYAPMHPGAKTLNDFCSMGGPDVAGTLAAVAAEAIKAVWYQKWWVHLRHRPESGGGLVHLQKTGQNTTEARVRDTVLNSQAVEMSFAKNNSYFLSPAFPEGSLTHPG